MATPKPSISIEAAVESDIPRLATIFTSAFSSDAHTQLKVASQPPGTQEDGMAEGLRHWITTGGNKIVLKAVVGEDIAGWVCWAWKGIEIDPTVEPSKSSKPSQNTFPNQTIDFSEPEPLEIAIRPAPSEAGEKSGIELLESITNADVEKWQARFMPSPTTRCMVIVAIAVDPQFQSQGVGSKLINWGLRRADNEGVYTWVSSSDGGWRHFESLGFKYCGGMQADLDKFADGVKREDGRNWGAYTWRFGLRKFTPK